MHRPLRIVHEFLCNGLYISFSPSACRRKLSWRSAEVSGAAITRYASLPGQARPGVGDRPTPLQVRQSLRVMGLKNIV